MSLVFEMSFVNLQFSEVINIEKSTNYNWTQMIIQNDFKSMLIHCQYSLIL